MREKTGLSDENILACLTTGYGIEAQELEFLPLGYDYHAGVYRARGADGSLYFVKVKLGQINAPGLITPRQLKDQGLEQVVAPLRDLAGGLWQRLGEYAVIVYPFVEGVSGMDVELSEAQWVEYGEIVGRIHTSRLSDELLGLLKRETFQPKHSRLVEELTELIWSHDFSDPAQAEMAAFWKARRRQIEEIVARTEELGGKLQGRGLRNVLCHADIHTANLLVTPAGGLVVVDWDEAILAPPERDFMFIIGGSVVGELIDEHHQALFFRGYGQAQVDWLALAYYRYEWVVQELGEFGASVFLSGQGGEVTRREALACLKSEFEPGGVVEVAYSSEKRL